MCESEKNTKSTALVFCYQNCSSDGEKNLEFKAEGREFSKILRSLEQFIQQWYFVTKIVLTYCEKKLF